METLDARIEAQLDGPAVRYADLVRFNFKSGERRLWGGFGLLVDGNGEQWTGLGELGKLSAISAGPGQAIQELTLSLFGSNAMLATIEADAAETTGREVVRYTQFFDVRDFDEAGRWVNWAPIGAPDQEFWGVMGAPYVDRPRAEVGASATRVISVRAANAFLNRRKPPFGFFSNRDQLARSNGDNIFVSISKMANATAAWPHGLS